MNKLRYTSVIILFNPNSTGASEKNAKQVQKDILEQAGDDLRVELVETKYAGHGEELAKKYAQSDESVLLISSSGDGGYHELINGVMNASDEKRNIVVSLIPSGNANDHFNATKSGDYIANVVGKNTRTMDVIKVTGAIDGKPWTRYAHSYVGFGISAHVGKRLTAADLNMFNEKLIVMKGLLEFRYVRLETDEGQRKYSSLVYSNIDRMSKVLKLSDESEVNDGKIEISEIRYRNVVFTIVNLVRMLFVDISKRHSITDDTFTTITKTPVQIDGEHFVLDADTDVSIQVVKQSLLFVS